MSHTQKSGALEPQGANLSQKGQKARSSQHINSSPFFSLGLKMVLYGLSGSFPLGLSNQLYFLVKLFSAQ